MSFRTTRLIQIRLCRLALVAAAAFIVACENTQPLRPGESEAAGFRVKAGMPLYEWHGDNLTGPVQITIDLSEQRASIRRGDQPAGWTYVATGKSGHGTQTGHFHVSEKVRDKVSTMWGQIVNSRGQVVVADAKAGRDGGGRFVGAPMPYWMRIYGAVGMHAGYIPDPGNPASHGCIRFPRTMAETLFGLVRIGTPVTITH